LENEDRIEEGPPMASAARAPVLAFLEAARQERQPSTTLLVLADWLEEHGDEARGRFLRLQSQAAALPVYDRQGRTLQAAAAELLQRHEAIWVGPFRSVARSWEFRGGLLELVIPVTVFLSPAMDAIFRQEVWAWVREVRLTGVTEAMAAELAVEPRLSQLTSLNLRYNTIWAAGAEALASSPHLASALSSLDLALNRVLEPGARALAESPRLVNLTSLDLWGNDIGDGGAQALAESPYLGNLISLNLERNRIGDAAARALAESPHLRNLTSLNLRGNPITSMIQLRKRFGDVLIC
jgi:uncharacterized protein (TIGR02996 family)